jgi:hypothetical protein
VSTTTLNLDELEREVAPEKKPTTDTLPDWQIILQSAAVTAGELQTLVIPPREALLARWFLAGDLGFLFGPRGLGKTWLAMFFAHAIAEGGPAGPWTAPKPRRVLYVDGEMGLDLTKQRDTALTKLASDNLLYLHHQLLFERTGKVLNLTGTLIQDGLLRYALANQVEVVFLDNLSCLFTGMKENDADAWELVLPWLLQLRRNGIAVVVVAHAGRNGLMRGTSRREDSAAWIIGLSELQDAGNPADGARFVSRFLKNRNATETDCPPLEWRFDRDGDNHVNITHRLADSAEILLSWVGDGLDTATALADEMNVSKGQISKLAKRLIAQGRLRKSGRSYAVADGGTAARKPYPD